MKGEKIWLVAAALFTGAAAFVFDLYTKRLFFDGVTAEGAIFSIWNGMIRSTLHQNFGISFNIPIPLWATLLITGLALSWALVILAKSVQTRALFSCMLIGIFIGGVLGNAYDRIMLGFVRDWILLFGRSAINVADILIASSLLAWVLQKSRKSPSEDPQA